MGSGTTAISAIKSERKYVGYDISEEYVSLAEKRIHSYISQTKINFADPK
jgi:site-specific DNA-methyltransferase (adenine-specific)